VRYFKKLYSNVKETIEDDFIDHTDEKKLGNNVALKLIANYKSPAGVTVKATGSSAANGSEVEGILEPELKFSAQNISLKGKLQTNCALEGTVTLNDPIGKGSALFVTGKIDDKGVKTVEVGADYTQKDVGTLNVKATVPEFDVNKADLYVAGVGVYNNVSIGGDVKVNTKQELSLWDLNLEYNKNDLTFALFAKFDKKKGAKSGFGYAQTLGNNIKGAFDYTFNHDTTESTLRFGTNSKIDESSSLKSRFSVRSNKEYRVGLVLKQNLNPTTRVTVTSDVNVRALFDGVPESGPGHQFGVAVSFFD